MSDTADDVGFTGRQLLNKAKVTPLRERMQDFLSDHDAGELRELRRSVSDGKDVSDIVIDDRDERF